MSKVERQQDNPSQGWQLSDARILGQILAAHNVVFTLPDTLRIAEFYAQILISIPGITACRVCLGGKSVQSGKMPIDVCAERETLCHSAWDNGKLIPTRSGFKCDLADQPGMRAIAIDSHQHHFGFFVFQMDKAALSALYQPFINNLSNYVALILENRWQKDMLQKSHDELERKVEERTDDLNAANEAIAASRNEALDMMKEAVEARKQAEQVSAALHREIAKHWQAEAALQRMNRQLRAISTCNQVLMQASDEQSLLEHICRIVCDEAGYRMAWVGYPQNDDAKTIRPMAWAGVEEGYLAEAGITWVDTGRGRGPAERALREGSSARIQDFDADPHAAPWRKSALLRGYRSTIALPLKEERAPPFGALCIYSAEPNAFTPDEIRLLEELAGNLAFGITTLRLRAEHKKAEKQILASEQLFRALVENAPDFIARYDREFRRIYINPAIQKLFGDSEGNTLDKTPADQSPLYAPQLYMDHLRQAIETATESTAEIPFRAVQGEMHWGHIRFVPEFDADGRVVSVLAIGRDIHEIKENELRFRMLAENFPDLVARFNHDGQYAYVNPAVEKAFGLPAEAIIGNSLRQLPQGRKPKQNEALLKLIDRAFDEGAANESEVCWDTKTGKRFYDIRHAPERDATGNVVSVLSIARDITERKMADEKLARYKEHLEEMVQVRTLELERARNKAQQYLDIAGVILVAIDTHGRVTLINQKGCEILEGTSDEIIGQDWFETYIPEKIRCDVIRGFKQLIGGESDPAEYFENPVLTRSGRQRLVAWHNVLLKDGEGQVAGTLSSGEDITQRRQAEEQIINLNQDLHKRASELEAANKELDAFAYSVSHDLRAPLRHIDGFIKLLQKKVEAALDEQGRHYMDTISGAAQKMGLLIDDLLSFSRMGRHALTFQPVELGGLLRDVVRGLSPDAAGRTIDWRIGDLPTVHGDAAMLRIVLNNLISNALKFTRPREQAQIEIGSLPGQETEVVIFVRDNGVGFDMAYADKLFGVFQRLHHADEFEGTGIGLANVRRIIARHGGRTWAQGEPEQGATFYFALPRT